MNKFYYTITYFAVLSLITLILYWKDKRAAEKEKWRVRERTLHLFSLLGGWPGALAAQKKFRHKTRKISFQIVFWITVILNVAAVIFIFTKDSVSSIFK